MSEFEIYPILRKYLEKKGYETFERIKLGSKGDNIEIDIVGLGSI